MRCPATTALTLGFGSTLAPYSTDAPHEGVDFGYDPDDKIYAPFSGIIMLIPNNGRDGNGLYMYNGEQFHGLLHSSQYLVKNGAMVVEGQPIAIMGDTGFAQGVHVHWCVKINGLFINPLTLLGEEIMQDDPNSVDHWKRVAQDRLNDTIAIAKEVSVDYKDANDLPQVVANIRTMAARIDQLTGLVSSESSDAALGQKIRELLGK